MKHTLAVLFYLRKCKADKAGMIPIYMRVTIDGRRIDLSSNRKIDPARWDPVATCVKGTTEDARTINHCLAEMNRDVMKKFNFLESMDKEINATTLKNEILGVSERKHTLIEIFEYHNEQVRLKIGKDFSVGTYRRYKVTLGKVKVFLKYQYRKADINLTEI